jgi:hypothetical protein
MLKKGIVEGKNLLIDSFIVSGDPGHNATYNIDGQGRGHGGTATALLNFTTGPNGGSLSIVGRIPGLGITSNVPLIASGTFSSWIFDPTGTFGAIGLDVINPVLLRALGLPAQTQLEFTLFTNFLPKNHAVIGSEFRTNPVVPEPASMLLVGTGIAAVVRARRRRVNA